MYNKKSLRIGVITGIFQPDIGGPSTHLNEVIPFLKKSGFDINVLSFGVDDSEEIVDGIQVRRVKRSQFVLIKFLKFFYRTYKVSRDSDILYLHDMSLVGLSVYLLSLIIGVRYVLRIGGDFVWEQAYEKGVTKQRHFEFQGNEPFPYSLRRKLGIHISKNAEAVIVPSKFLKEVVIKWGIAAEHIHIVHNAIDECRHLSLRHDLNGYDILVQIKRYKEQGKIIVIASGRFVLWKNFFLLLDSLSTLPHNFQMIFVGEGPLYGSILQTINKKNLKDRVSIYKSVPRDILMVAIASSDIFILPSEGDTFSFVALEAYLTGTPLVLANTGALPEIFGLVQDDGVTFLSSLTKEGIRDALIDDRTKERPSKSGQERLRSVYNIQTLREKTKEVLYNSYTNI